MDKPFLRVVCLSCVVGLIIILFASSPPTHAQTLNYLHTNGSQILDENNHPVLLTGISWFGLETESFAPHGLWARNWESILDQVVKLGFNIIRLPYSNQLLDPASLPNSINYELNPDLKGLNGLEIMDKIIQGAGERGLKVILDRHRPDSHAQSELWYTPQVSEEQWINDWVMLVKRYAGNDTVIGVDLHNEPHGRSTWGSGDPATDWRLAAEKAGNAILAVNPKLLIIVQGIEQYNGDWYWWGGNLIGAKDYPIRLNVPNQLVYSTHTYGPGVYPQPWFSDPKFPDNLPGIWYRHWGYLSREGIAPVIVGEFGGRSVGTDKEGIWQKALFSYLRENNISYIYWTINPDSGDTGGLLLDDWQTVDKAKEALLSGYQFPIIGIEQQGTQPTQGVPAQAASQATPSPAPIVATLTLRYRTANPSPQATDSKPEFIIANTGNTSVPLNRVELFYWFQDSSSQPFVFHCDWAQVGCGAILGDFQTAGGDQYLRLQFDSTAAVLAPGQDSGEIKVRFNRADWSQFNQADNYSFAPFSDYTDWPRVTLYVDGKLAWGIEPSNPLGAMYSTPPAVAQASPSSVPTSPPPSNLAVGTPGIGPAVTASPTETALPIGTAVVPGKAGTPDMFLLLVGVLAALGLGLVVFQIVHKAGSPPR